MTFRRALQPVFSAFNVARRFKRSEDEHVARYIFDSKHFSRENRRVKHRALEPAPEDHKTSVYRITGLSPAEIWTLGEVHVATPRGKKLLARADLSQRAIESVGLALEIDNIPPRQGNITGWPVEKDEWRSLALELAALATLVILPNS